MGQTGMPLARFWRPVRGLIVAVLTIVAWGGFLADPATSPAALAAQPRSLSLNDELTLALTERIVQFRAEAASRSQAAPPVVWPARGGLTGWFGEPRGGHRHPGIDIDGDTGAPVAAAAAGKVVSAGPSPAGYAGYGTMVMIAHGDGLASIYAHLSSVAVKTGQQVDTGQRVGAIGTTGSVSGSHLHFELRRNGVAVDPRRWLPPR